MLIVILNLVGIAIFSSDFRKSEFTAFDILNLSFTFIYLLDTLTKIIATGLISGRKSFLRVAWNYVDAFIIITGLLFSLVSPLRNVKACIIINMFRSVKLTYATTSMKRLMTPWLHSLRKMGNVFAVLILFILVFAATGIAGFGGNRYFRCRLTPEPVDGVWEIDTSINRLCNARGLGSFDCPQGTYCGTPYDYGLKPTHDEQYGDVFLSYGAVGYENIFRAFLITFQMVTFDDWTKVMYRMQDSNDAIFARFFFPCFIFIGAFLCLNLIVAVIVDTFQGHRQKLREKDERKLLRMKEGIELSTPKALELVQKEPHFVEQEQSKVQDESVEKEIKDSSEQEENPYIDKEESMDKLVLRKTKSEKVEEDETKKVQSGLKGFCMKIKENKTYKSIIIGLVLLNLLILALKRKGMSDKEVKVYNIFDAIIATMFFLEMIVELGALGFSEYVRTKYIDIFINILSIIQLILTWTAQFDSKLYL